MPLEYLSQLSSQPLPVRVEDLPAIDKLRVLRAAHLIVADLPEAGHEAAGAQVTAITAEGRAALRRAGVRAGPPH